MWEGEGELQKPPLPFKGYNDSKAVYFHVIYRPISKAIIVVICVWRGGAATLNPTPFTSKYPILRRHSFLKGASP